jgi:hypothetical protein
MTVPSERENFPAFVSGSAATTLGGHMFHPFVNLLE